MEYIIKSAATNNASHGTKTTRNTKRRGRAGNTAYREESRIYPYSDRRLYSEYKAGEEKRFWTVWMSDHSDYRCVDPYSNFEYCGRSDQYIVAGPSGRFPYNGDIWKKEAINR